MQEGGPHDQSHGGKRWWGLVSWKPQKGGQRWEQGKEMQEPQAERQLQNPRLWRKKEEQGK
jgi:hypothetical protein